MPDPERIAVFLRRPATRRLLRWLTRKRRGGGCLLDEIFAKYGDPALSLVDRVRFGPLFLLIDYITKYAGSSPEAVREKVMHHTARARALVNTARGIAEYGLTAPQVFSAPLMVVWNFTQACNLKCVHCYQDAQRALPDELTFQEKLAVVDQLVEMDVPLLAFSGGEPLMGRDFWPVLEHASAKGLHIQVATNGTLLTQENVSRLADSGASFVEVSLDSAQADVHDEFRGQPGAWERAVAGIRNAVAQEGLRVGVATTVTRRNFGELRRIIDFAIELGADCFFAFNFIPTGRGREMAAEDITPQMREEMLRILQEYLEGKRISIVSSAPQLGRVCLMHPGPGGIVNTGHYGDGPGSTTVVLARYIGGCGAGRCYMAIQPNGDMTPCVFMPIVSGNLRRQSMAQVWRENALLKVLRDRTDRTGACRRCRYRFHCGGCRARSWGYFGDVRAPDPGCIRNLEAWERLIQTREPLEMVAAGRGTRG